MIYYLMSKYRGRESESIEENNVAFFQMKDRLKELGLTEDFIFSPISYSHHLEVWRTKKTQNRPYCKLCKTEISTKGFADGYAACACREYQCAWNYDGTIDFFCNLSNEELAKFIRWEYVYEEPDWVQDDLNFLEHIHDEDGCQSEIVGVLLPSAYHCDEHGIHFDSRGAKREYEFMKWHSILVITLDTFLHKDPGQWFLQENQL